MQTIFPLNKQTAGTYKIAQKTTAINYTGMQTVKFPVHLYYTLNLPEMQTQNKVRHLRCNLNKNPLYNI